MAKPEIIKSVTEILHKYMEQNKLRKTQERFQILKFIYDWDRHFDVDDLYNHLKESGFAVSKATVYNTLELLLEAGLIRKHHFRNNTSYYEKSYFNHSHDHVIFLDEEGNVKEIVEFCDPRIDSIKADLEKILDINITGHDLYFYTKSKK